MKPEDLEAIEKRAEAASPGPWTHNSKNQRIRPFLDFCVKTANGKEWKIGDAIYNEDCEDAKFIAHARADIPLLCAELRKAWKQLEIAKNEAQALRSVLSEWDQDKSCYVQYIRANELREDREDLEKIEELQK